MAPPAVRDDPRRDEARPCWCCAGASRSIAIAAGKLDADDFPGDPADRIIYATAQASRAPLITRDRAIRRFAGRDAVW